MPKRNPAIKKYTSRGQTKYKFQVSVTKTLAYGLGGKYGSQPPKTKAGIRTVPLTDQMAARIR